MQGKVFRVRSGVWGVGVSGSRGQGQVRVKRCRVRCSGSGLKVRGPAVWGFQSHYLWLDDTLVLKVPVGRHQTSISKNARHRVPAIRVSLLWLERTSLLIFVVGTLDIPLTMSSVTSELGIY